MSKTATKMMTAGLKVAGERKLVRYGVGQTEGKRVTCSACKARTRKAFETDNGGWTCVPCFDKAEQQAEAALKAQEEAEIAAEKAAAKPASTRAKKVVTTGPAVAVEKHDYMVRGDLLDAVRVHQATMGLCKTSDAIVSMIYAGLGRKAPDAARGESNIGMGKEYNYAVKGDLLAAVRTYAAITALLTRAAITALLTRAAGTV